MVVQPGAGGEVEPGVLDRVELLDPQLPGGVAAQLVDDLLRPALGAHPVLQAELQSKPGELLQLLVRPEEEDVGAGRHARNRLLRDAGEGPLRELEEVQVRPIPEEEHLEVVLIGQEDVVDHVVVGLQQPVAGVEAGTLGDDRLFLDPR